jgi:T-complex protein 1 subunit beta
MSCAVDEAARGVKGKRALATEAFGRALRQIPVILADNAGFDSSDLVAKLRATHYDGQNEAGLGMFFYFYFVDWLIGVLVDMDQGSIASMRTLGVTESYKLKRQVVSSASEAAEMVIRCVTPYYIFTVTYHAFSFAGWMTF